MGNLTEKSKTLSFLLRHDDKGYEWDETGWRSTGNLISKHHFTMSELIEIVKNDNKGRYEFNEDRTQIRAVQGHSIPNIFPDLTEITKDNIRLIYKFNDNGIIVNEVYHGTSSRFTDSIDIEGIKSMSRNYVQMTNDKATAINVGQRHGGKLVLYVVDVWQMVNDGIKVFLSKNGVIMTQYVDPKYLISKCS